MALTTNQIDYIARHKEQITTAYATQIYFSFDSVEAGELAFDYLMAAYPNDINYSAYSGWFGWGDKRDFYLGFTDAETRNRILNELTKATDITNPDSSLNVGGVSVLKGNTALYVVAGAVVFIVAMLLWKRLRK